MKHSAYKSVVHRLGALLVLAAAGTLLLPATAHANSYTPDEMLVVLGTTVDIDSGGSDGKASGCVLISVTYNDGEDKTVSDGEGAVANHVVVSGVLREVLNVFVLQCIDDGEKVVE